MREAIYKIIGSTVLLGVLFFPSKTEAAFPDVPRSHPNYDAILYVQSEGIVSGYPDGMFRPDQTINRAEFVKIMVESGTFQSGTNCDLFTDFPDVPRLSWFASFVNAARCSGLIDGYPDGTFKPVNTISFVEASKIITVQHASHVGINSPIDHGPSGEWYYGPVARLEAYDAIPKTIMGLTDKLTRGEMAEILYRLEGEHYNSPSQSLEIFHDPSLLSRRETQFFDRATLRKGDVLQLMKVESITSDSVVFVGAESEDVQGVHGNYKEQATTQPDCPVLVFEIASDMSNFMPRERGNEALEEICLDNSIEELHERFIPGSSGTVNLNISRYIFPLKAGIQKHRAVMGTAYVEPDAVTLQFDDPEYNWLEWRQYANDTTHNGYFDFYIHPPSRDKGNGGISWGDDLNPTFLTVKQGDTILFPSIDLFSLSPVMLENAARIQKRQVSLKDFIFINDLNDDGYADIRILQSRTPLRYSYWHYDPANQRYSER
ncbi:hypothetical protein A3H22_01545 [Candidatus Peribacteria bacterium RIFCSPLOWO2_12_FULL_55_15]|nr:MAG: hypothetical protein A2789_02165 [Candidatus Peribacteria bacterium RIFCSPHIGHO2_01_FULL_54_22]OGJ65079.1 MAG: hypothetical protein A3E47_01970 [Candidatus Peribacteria bacterium RIFCSPHIGHO2_12_FULL_54_10]OGJ70265.1 MAG: hypothetical protein A3H90_03375 [Candidatus Peribacteria bacterium RIFCSPLOWO2_02_FULL_55_36]OGJ72253.1 MAG: hypothetical protein A3H22_01545 [Candidatus Peribacteria bacterium RIFCSPLOWO2_12_FULL_55_15]